MPPPKNRPNSRRPRNKTRRRRNFASAFQSERREVRFTNMRI
jgi:hypothetical protein